MTVEFLREVMNESQHNTIYDMGCKCIISDNVDRMAKEIIGKYDWLSSGYNIMFGFNRLTSLICTKLDNNKQIDILINDLTMEKSLDNIVIEDTKTYNEDNIICYVISFNIVEK